MSHSSLLKVNHRVCGYLLLMALNTSIHTPRKTNRELGHDPLVVDNLVNSSMDTLECVTQITGAHNAFSKLDVCEVEQFAKLPTEKPSESTIHFAGLNGLHVVVSKAAGCAPSVRHMKGVFEVETTVESIAEGMALSRIDWQGPIEAPEILQYTPKEFAEVFLAAFRFSVAT